MKRTTLLTAAAFVVLGLYGCDDLSDLPSGASDVVAVTETEVDAVVGDVVPVTVRVTDAAGAGVAGQTVTWTVDSGEGTVANAESTTNAEGEAQNDWTLGTTSGENRLTASVEDVGEVVFTAQAAPGEVATLEVSEAEVALASIEETAELAATPQDEHGNTIADATITWSSDAESVATVSTDGVVTAQGNGTATITASSQGVDAQVAVTVEQEVAAIALAPELDTVPRYETVTFEASAVDANGHAVADVALEWSSADADVAEVDGDGAVTGRTMGEVEITASAGDHEAAVTVLVAPALADALSATWRQSCALEADGTAYCWGDNQVGQLGVGHISKDEPTPTPVVGGLKFQSIRTAIRATCGLSVDGGLYCWGGWYLNGFEPSTEPVRKDDRTYTHLAADMNHACAIDEAGDVYCWGGQGQGEIGNGTNDSQVETPTRASNPEAMVAIEAGSGHVCAIGESGDTYCWGRGTAGQLGTGTTESANTPQVVSTTETFTRLALGGSQSCGLTAEGDMHCWGYGYFGNGDDFELQATPIAAASGLRFRNASGGPGSVCATTDDGQAYCWGSSSAGRIGLPSGGALLEPEPVGEYAYISIALQASHSCAIGLDGTISCTGAEADGVLGDGTRGYATTPQTVLGPGDFEQVEAGWAHSCGLTDSGEAWCWGAGAAGQLGHGSFEDRTEPVQVSGGHTFTDLSLGYYHSCGLTASGEAWCWGANGDGQVGSGSGETRHATPQQVASSGVIFSQIGVGYYSSCAVTGDGDAYCWGWNGYYSFGNGTNGGSPTPVPAADGVALSSIEPSVLHSCGVGTDGTGYCWGYSAYGTLGTGIEDFTIYTTPVEVSGGHSWRTISAGLYTTCGVTQEEAAYCWGYGGGGTLGQGDRDNRLEPAAVQSGTAFSDITVIDYTACATRSDGALYCWGDNAYGEVGDGNAGYIIGDVLTPAQVGGISGVTTASIAGDHACAAGSGGTFCWGLQANGRLGDGQIGYRDFFAPVDGDLTAAAGGLAGSGLIAGAGLRTPFSAALRAPATMPEPPELEWRERTPELPEVERKRQ